MQLENMVRTAWDGVMNEERNPLRNFPLMTAHMMMQVLAWLWSAVFALAFSSYVVFGFTAIGHALILAGLFATLAVFSEADRRSVTDRS